MAPRRGRQRSDPFVALGLTPEASADDVRRARNDLAKRRHPDVGGTAAAMQEINVAAAEALEVVAARTRPSVPSHGTSRKDPADGRRGTRDHPSFTIEALPVEAFEALLLAAGVLGQVGDDEPPYRLDVLLDEPLGAWCRVELVPDGGGSTVSLTVSGHRASVLDVRDAFVAELNQLDWTADGPRQPLS